MTRWLALALALAGCGQAPTSDWERKHEAALPAPDEVPPLPRYPQSRDLVEFYVAATSEFRFFIDSASVGVGNGVVHYVLVARSGAGAENVSFEGMRCESGEVRIYAVGRDGGWYGKPGGWRAIQPRSVQRWHNALYREYFCPQREAIASAREGVEALRRGGHAQSKGLSEDIPRAR